MGPMREEMTMTTAGLGTLVRQRTMALAVRHTSFGNTRQAKQDKVKIEKTEDGVETDKKMYRVMKDLIESPELEAITSFDGETGALLRHLGHASKFQHKGMYTVSGKMVNRIQALMKDREAARAELVSVAVEKYPTRVAEASAKLGVIHDPNDYISQEAFADKFSFVWQWVKVTVPDILRDYDPALFEAETAKEQELNEKLAIEMRAAAREAVSGMVRHLRMQLTPTDDGKRRRFYASSVVSIQEFLDLFALRNDTDDDELAAIVAQARAVIADATPEDFKDKSAAGDGFRESMREEMLKLEAAIEPLVETVKTRRIRLDAPESAVA
jgi:hypothetical protein